MSGRRRLREGLRRAVPRSLAGRLTLAAVAAVAVALVVAGAAVVVTSERSDRSTLDRDLERAATRVVPRAREIIGAPGPREGLPPPPGPPPDFDSPGDVLQPEPNRFVRIVGPQGAEVLAAGGEVPDDFPVVDPGDVRTVRAGGEDWRTVTRPLGPGGSLIQAAGRLEPLRDAAARLRLAVGLAVLAALGLTALLARWLVRIALVPLGGLRDAAGRIATSGDPAERMPAADGPEEVNELAADLDAMLERLERSAAEREQALEAARRFAADAGHELRTPLTSLTANLSSATAGSAEPEAVTEALRASEADASRLATLVAQLQALARGEAGSPLETTEVDLAELAEASVAALRSRRPDLEVSIAAPDEGVRVRGDAGGLSMLLGNLLDNAAAHGTADGAVAISLRIAADGSAELTVDDDGPGIPAGERERVLRRFERGSGASGPGTGLGLAIALAQAERHGGTLSLGDSPAGEGGLGGLCVTLRLPTG